MATTDSNRVTGIEPEYLVIATGKGNRWSYDTEETDLDVLEWSREGTDEEVSTGSSLNQPSYPRLQEYFDSNRPGVLVTDRLESRGENELSGGEKLGEALRVEGYDNIKCFYVTNTTEPSNVYGDPFRAIVNYENASDIINTVLEGGEKNIMAEVDPLRLELEDKINQYDEKWEAYQEGRMSEDEMKKASKQLETTLETMNDILERPGSKVLPRIYFEDVSLLTGVAEAKLEGDGDCF